MRSRRTSRRSQRCGDTVFDALGVKLSHQDLGRQQNQGAVLFRKCSAPGRVLVEPLYRVEVRLVGPDAEPLTDEAVKRLGCRWRAR